VISATGEVIEKRDGGTVIQFPVFGCASCHNPCSNTRQGRQVKEVFLAGVWLHRPRLTVSGRSYARILANSLGLPLAGFIAGASLMHQAGGGDVATFVGAIAGLVCGVAVCRRQSLNLFQIKEAKPNA
jgi:outer membrane lipoprotein SlyB